MREILFRGKREDGEGWAYGHYHKTEYVGYPNGGDNVTTRHYILPQNAENAYRVIPETVGQFTGLTDKNGKKIFEGDIIKTHYVNANKNNFVEQVVFHNGRFCGMYKLSENGRMYASLPDGVPHLPQDKTAYMDWCEVIGNIHDNPELLEGEER